MDYRWKVTNTGRRSPGTRVPMVAQILQRNVHVVKSMLPAAAARPGFNPIERQPATRVSRDVLTRVTRTAKCKGMSSPSPSAAHVFEFTSVQLAVHKQRDLNLPGQRRRTGVLQE